ncbi:hypothetical protein BGW80DRAFT_1457229 [Lactifluus volemus]|nr:hypothetical protein BGW80DRAFT_1457229 [Lactifluus volemus]
MSTLHSCHWDWCRFTTVLHHDFVQHVISTHIDNANPVKRQDINLIRHLEQGAPANDSGTLSIELPTSSQLEPPQSASQSIGSSENVLVSPEPPNSQMANRLLSFTSGSTRVFPLSLQKPQTGGSKGVPVEAQSQDVSQVELRTQAAYDSQIFD